MTLTAADWAGLCALTETSRPEEQEYVLWTIRGRVESPRYPDTYEKVVLQPKQFSRFDYLTGPFGKTLRAATPAEAFASMSLVKTANGAAPLLAAIHLAEHVLDLPPTMNPFAAFLMQTKAQGSNDPGQSFAAGLKRAQDVLHYYSPKSMRPAGYAPAWAKSAKYLFTPPGIDPNRFIFAEGVP